MRVSFAENLLAEIHRKLPEIEEIQCYQLCYGLTSLGRNTDSAKQLLLQCHSTEYNELQQELFELNVKEIQTLLMDRVPCVGVWWHQHFFGSQLTPIAKRLASMENYLYLGLISAGCLDQGTTRSSEKDFTFSRYLLIPEDVNLALCGFLDAVFFGESFHHQTYLPRDVIRIGQPHGLDIPLDHALVKYGGGWIFDYILCSMKEEKKPKNYYYNIFPRPLIEHSSTHVCAIPAGYSKLDHFFQVSKTKPIQKKIIYHISLWEVETEVVRKNIGTIISTLIEKFEDRIVLFRPDPVDIDNPELIQRIIPWLEHPRFKFSNASSYIDDYADAEVLVTHRTSTAHTFSYATGRPIIVLQGDIFDHSQKRLQKTETGYLVFNEDQLIKKVQQVLDNTDIESERIRKSMNKTIHHPGHAVDYIIDNLDTILRRESLDEWESFRLFDPKDQMQLDKQVLQCLENSTRWGTLGTNIAEATIEHFPENARYRLIAAEFYCRVSNPFQHTFYFRGWYQAVSHIAKASDICSEQEVELRTELYTWVIQKGMHMAHCVKWYVCQQDSPEFGDDIDSIITKFCIEDADGESFKKYPHYMELIWRLRKPIGLIKKVMRTLGYSGE